MEDNLKKKGGDHTDTYQGQVSVDVRTVAIPVRCFICVFCSVDKSVTLVRQSVLAVKYIRCDPENEVIKQGLISVSGLYPHMIWTTLIRVSRH